MTDDIKLLKLGKFSSQKKSKQYWEIIWWKKLDGYECWQWLWWKRSYIKNEEERVTNDIEVPKLGKLVSHKI